MGDVVKFPRQRQVRSDEPAESIIVRHARDIADMLGDDLQGFFIVGIRGDGSYSNGWRKPAGMGTTLFGAMVVEAARQEIITQTEAVYVFNNQSGQPAEDDDGA